MNYNVNKTNDLFVSTFILQTSYIPVNSRISDIKITNNLLLCP